MSARNFIIFLLQQFVHLTENLDKWISPNLIHKFDYNEAKIRGITFVIEL